MDRSPAVAEAVLLIHGCGGSPDTWVRAGWATSPALELECTDPVVGRVSLYRAAGSDVFSAAAVFLLDYQASNKPIEYIANALARGVRHSLQAVSAPSAVLVTHSMGALVARCYLQGYAINATYNRDVAGILMVAPPNQGQRFVKSLTKPIFTPLTCAQVGQLDADSPLIRTLNGLPLPADIAYCIIAGEGFKFLSVDWGDGILLVSETRLPEQLWESLPDQRFETVDAHHGDRISQVHAGLLRGKPSILEHRDTKRIAEEFYAAL